MMRAGIPGWRRVATILMSLMLCAGLALAGTGPEPEGDSEPVAPVASTPPASVPGMPLTSVDLSFEGVPIPDRLRAAVAGPTESLARDEAIARAVVANPGLKAARERVEMARGEYRRRSAANNPTLSIGGTLVPQRKAGEDTESQLPDTDETYLSHVFPTSGSRAIATRSAQARWEEAQAVFRTVELDLVQQVKQAYVDLQVSQESIRVYEDTYRIGVTLTALARRQVEAGAVPETNVLRTQVEEARAEQDIRRAQAERLVREAQLGLLVGVPAGHRLSASDRLNPNLVVPGLPELTAMAVAQRPELAGGRSEVAALAQDVELARAQRKPDLTVQAQFTDELTNTGNPPFKASIQLPLWDRGRIAGEVARARAERRSAALALEQVRRQVEVDVVKALRQFEGARAVLAVFEGQVIPRTRTILDRSKLGYLAGTGTVLDILDAQRVFRQAALDTLNATGDVARAAATLDRAVAGPAVRVAEPAHGARRDGLRDSKNLRP